MNSFRFSPVKSKEKLLEALEYIHFQSFVLCKQNLGRILPVAGNIGFFCHYEDEFEYLTNLRKEMTDTNWNWNNKYYHLHAPIVIPEKNDVPETTYTFLYIRKPTPDAVHVGDVDFYLPPKEYENLKKDVVAGRYEKEVRIFERPDLDLVRLYDPDIDVSAFVGSYDLDTVALRQ